jgi:UDP-N-acetylmuramate: L-alanyl-gamma-D-glutamyl-meso-diaminopimelate ligase
VQTFGPEGAWHYVTSNHPTHFTPYFKGVASAPVNWNVTGEHNRMNGLAALAAAHHVGVPIKQAVGALNTFGGVKRRMEIKGVVNDITVYDDFAHHPTAIATTLQGLRNVVGNARILAVIEPRSNTMKLGTMAAKLPHALEQADLTFCFGETEGKHALGWDPQNVLAPLGKRAKSFSSHDALVKAVKEAAQPGDHVLIMSNGSFGGIHTTLLAALGSP